MPPKGAYRFITYPRAQDQSARDTQRSVRSHVASLSHPGHAPRPRRPVQTVPGERVLDLSTNSVQPSYDVSETAQTSIDPRQTRQTAASNARLISNVLSGVAFSPISQLATYHKPYLPGILQHYIHNLTIPIPELDGSPAGPLFRAAWIPLVVHDPVIFQIVVLFAATHFATYAEPRRWNALFLELLSLKQAALVSLARKVQTDSEISDVLIAAAAKMASYEAIFGTAEAVSQISVSIETF
jgi:hypothetical protein